MRRTVKSMPTPSVPRRLAVNTSASADGLSSQCASFNHDHDRCCLSGRGQKGQGCDRDGETLVPASGTVSWAKSERGSQRLRLHGRQAVDQTAQRPDHIGQSRVRDFRFRLKAIGA